MMTTRRTMTMMAVSELSISTEFYCENSQQFWGQPPTTDGKFVFRPWLGCLLLEWLERPAAAAAAVVTTMVSKRPMKKMKTTMMMKMMSMTTTTMTTTRTTESYEKSPLCIFLSQMSNTQNFHPITHQNQFTFSQIFFVNKFKFTTKLFKTIRATERISFPMPLKYGKEVCWGIYVITNLPTQRNRLTKHTKLQSQNTQRQCKYKRNYFYASTTLANTQTKSLILSQRKPTWKTIETLDWHCTGKLEEGGLTSGGWMGWMGSSFFSDFLLTLLKRFVVFLSHRNMQFSFELFLFF